MEFNEQTQLKQPRLFPPVNMMECISLYFLMYGHLISELEKLALY